MSKFQELQHELNEAKKELEILNWGLNKTNEAIKILYKDLEQKNKDLQSAKDKLAIFASQDSLTKFLNRSSFNKKLARCINSNNHSETKKALLFLDLDDFKFVNDKFGHQIGDLLLQEVSKRLRQVVKEKDICARYGGDEFAILLMDLPNTQAATCVAERIVETIRSPFCIKGNNINTSVSIGIALFTPNTITSKELYFFADMAMYQAKNNGKNCYQIYSKNKLTKKEKE